MRSGLLPLNKHDGGVSVVESESDTDAITDFVVARVETVLRRLWERDGYPVDTDYRD